MIGTGFSGGGAATSGSSAAAAAAVATAVLRSWLLLGLAALLLLLCCGRPGSVLAVVVGSSCWAPVLRAAPLQAPARSSVAMAGFGMRVEPVRAPL